MLMSKDFYSDFESGLYGEKNLTDSLAMIYHENSKLNRFNNKVLGERIAKFYNPYITERSILPYKHYLGCEKIDLSVYGDFEMPKVDLYNTILSRRSIREFNPSYKISERELFIILNYSYAVTHKEKVDGSESYVGMRPVPSPGGLYSLEIYLVLFNSAAPPGLYHFRPDLNALERIYLGDLRNDCSDIVNTDPWTDLIENACGLVVTTGLFERLSIKYGDRAYRFMLHESGFVAQNMSLLFSSIGLGSCMLGGYIDNHVNGLLDVDGAFETVQNIMAFGKPK